MCTLDHSAVVSTVANSRYADESASAAAVLVLATRVHSCARVCPPSVTVLSLTRMLIGSRQCNGVVPQDQSATAHINIKI